MILQQFQRLNKKIVKCKRCPRLASYIEWVSRTKVKRFSNEEYWGKPLGGFGDFSAELLIVGLAPAAHGGNRTGRMFTGDSSGDWLAKVLYENGFATKPTSKRADDGFGLINAYVTASVRCAPPANKPLKEELENCSSYLKEELTLLKRVSGL
jgi:uracil-DNA glycosylase family 4